MANQLQAKLAESSATCTSSSSSSSSSAASALRRQGESLSSDSHQATPPAQTLPWRPKKRTLQQEQMSFRFKEKIKSQSVSSRDEQVCSGSDVCVFCQQKVYVMERLSAEGLFFHRSCFCCDSCGAPLRPPSYAFQRHSGRFYCLQHPECQLRRRPASAVSHRTSSASPASLSDSLRTAERRRSSAASVMAPAAERIELEIYRRISKEELQEEPEEVSEEILNHFNLSADHPVQIRCSSEEEEEEEDGGGTRCGSSEEAAASWSETPPHLRDQEEEEESSDKLSHQTSDTPVEQDSASITFSLTPPTALTPSTASFFTSYDSAPEPLVAKAPSSPVVATMAAQKRSAGVGRGSFDDITPELPQNKPLPHQKAESEENKSDGNKMRRPRGSHSLPHHLLTPLQAGGGACQQHLTQREAEMGGGGARALWKALFLGNRKELKKKGGALPTEGLRKKTANQSRATVTGEESDLDSATVLQRCSLKPQNNLQLELLDLMSDIQRVTLEKKEEENKEQTYVPHALAFRRSYPIKNRPIKDRVQDSDGQSSCPTEVVGVLVHPKEVSSLSVKESLFQKEQENQDQDLDTKTSRRVQRTARRQAKQEELKRLHKAQMIQRQLQQVEVRQRELEDRGVMVEKALRGEADYWEDSGHSPDLELHLGGPGRLDNVVLMQRWFQLVQQKNSLVRYEAELIIFAQELELEDRQSRLQQELRDRMAMDDQLKGEEQLQEEHLLLQEMLEVVEQRDVLVALLEEQRLLDHQEDQDLEQVLMAGQGLSWT
ncbi:protein-methionine sulfoxide oxidase mical3a isoform X2 [Austrofundulus limnaeus]|uniref:Protein-methionine sulfoxide oxidase mical3a isoform X2 n=1 Tax=Austrofundulus limnaeus TaxID=52670 RepID=A0A2I4CMY3_AUSLI|nr:PREDICTED: protein-methionine sulfoxide oxidase mical3a-like isoform X2 [Austrofundulus limnaeus]